VPARLTSACPDHLTPGWSISSVVKTACIPISYRFCTSGDLHGPHHLFGLFVHQQTSGRFDGVGFARLTDMVMGRPKVPSVSFMVTGPFQSS
jgi:hypothetical protein